jgi:CRP/FNR family transcriptional regulator, anaerobic regulatory protein
MVQRRWLDRFSSLAQLPDDIKHVLEGQSRVTALQAGARIFGPGQAPANFLLVLTGTVRVQQLSESGREILLYRISDGESCALTTACLLGYKNYQAEGIAETPLEAVAVPRATFDELIAISPLFRRFVFTGFSERLTDLFRVIEDVAFSRIDVRLSQKLLERADAAGEVAMTHQELAAELGSAREVISRQLHEFQRRGWVQSGRGKIMLCDRDALHRLAQSH